MNDPGPLVAAFLEGVRAIEKGWQETLGAVRDQERIRTAALKAQLARQEERIRRAMIALVALGAGFVVVVVAGLAVLSSQTSAIQDQADRLNGVVAKQERQRRVALIDRCRQTNDLTAGLRSFVRKVAPDLLPLAEHQFRVVPNCARYADRLLRSKRPPTPPRGGSGR